MNPIPLSAPDGRVYAYACGVCHHVAGGTSIWGHPVTDGPIGSLVEWSQRDATRCCTCSGCGFGPAGDRECDDCARVRWGHWMWSQIATCMQYGFMTEEQLDAYLSADDDD